MVKENKIEEKEVLSKKKTNPDDLQVAKQSILDEWWDSWSYDWLLIGNELKLDL